MKILILGVGGMLGHKMFQCFQERFDGVSGTLRGRASDSPYSQFDFFKQGNVHEGIDVMDLPALDAFLKEQKPDVIVNSVGVIKQRSEAKAALPSITINSLLPHRLADLAAGWGGRVIHFSTDCVFNGKRGDYTEDDPSDAEDLYGKSKYLGEVAVENALTLRTSIIGRELTHHKSLLDWFLSQNGKTVKGFKRAYYSGLTTNELARVVAMAIARFPDLSGLYQAASPTINKYDLLLLLKDAYRLETEVLPDEEFFCDRSMRSERFRQATGYVCPSWPELVHDLAADSTPYEPLA